jgi:hypothetical protein
MQLIINDSIMKLTIYLIFILITVPYLAFSQAIVDVDFISTMHEDRAAIKKGNQWAFIDSEGKIAINYRDDLVATNTENGDFPVFKNGRCLITQKKDGISYFGYINTLGEIVIEPQYLNATNFTDNLAIVLLLNKTEISKNVALNKTVVSYGYFEVAIDLNGKALTYLSEEPTHITLSSDYIRKPPAIYSKIISDALIAVINSQKKWSIVKVQ